MKDIARQGRQGLGKVNTPSKPEKPSNIDTQVGRHWVTIGGKERMREGDTPSNTGTHARETMETRGGPQKDGHTIQHRHKFGETMRDLKGNETLGRGAKTIQHRRVGQWETNETRSREGRRAIQDRRAYKCGGIQHSPHMGLNNEKNRKQGEAKPREGGHTMRHRHTCGETWAGRTHHSTRVGRQSGTMGDKALRKARAPLRETTRQIGDNGTPWETRGGKTSGADGPSKKGAYGETTGNKGMARSGKRTHHQTQAHVGRQWEIIENNWRQGPGRRSAPSNTSTQAGRHWEAIGAKGRTSERWSHHPTQAHM